MGWRDAFDVLYLRHLHEGGGVEHVWSYGIVSHHRVRTLPLPVVLSGLKGDVLA